MIVIGHFHINEMIIRMDIFFHLKSPYVYAYYRSVRDSLSVPQYVRIFHDGRK